MVGNLKKQRYIDEIITQFIALNKTNEEKLDFYKGVLIKIKMGQGKTTLINELKDKYSCVNSYIYDANSAKENDFSLFLNKDMSEPSLIFIDDIDILIKEDRKAIKELMKFMSDETHPAHLIIGTCSETINFDKRLLKPNYFSQCIKFKELNTKEKGEFVKVLLANKGRSFEKTYKDEEVGAPINGYSLMDIKLIIDYLLLHHVGENVINFDEYCKTILHYLNDCEEFETNQKELSIHEAGHVVVGAALKNYFPVGAYVSNASLARTTFVRKSEVIMNDKSMLDVIKTSIAGPLVTKLIYGRCDVGGTKDLDEARYQIRYLINRVGYFNIADTIDGDRSVNKLDSAKLAKNTMLENKLFRKCEKDTMKILKKNKSNIFKIADVLTKKGYITLNEILKVLNINYQMGS